jgi:hypothetical protein
VRPGSVANRNRLRQTASRHHGRRAEAGGKANQAKAGGQQSGISPDIVNRSNAVCSTVIDNRSNDIACARFDISED